MLTIRTARREDTATIFAFIRELAEFEKLLHEVDATEADITEALFGEAPRVFCEIALWDGQPVGCAIWFYNFSTFRGRCGIYLEDLYVRPAHRGRGIGKALLAQLASRCLREGLSRLEWWVLDWNERALAFYRSIGARPMSEWTVQRLTGDALAALARGGPRS
jgi:GNAT superfamily N-acetyltransferase